MRFFNFQTAAFFVALILTASGPLVAGARECEISLWSIKGERVKLTVEVADDDESRRTGLMFRSSLQSGRGMLFVFDAEEVHSFWMKNTYIPLSIAYIDSKGLIVDIQDMKPFDYSISYISKKPAMYALEVNMGWFKKNQITTGSRISFNGCIGK